jgi:predicted deacylase
MDMTDRRSAVPDPDAATSQQTSSETPIARTSSRRQFLQYAGGGLGIASLLVASGCDSDSGMAEMEEMDDMEDMPVVLDFSNDFGVLNYAYALEQLESAFYAEAAANFYGDTSSVEGQYFRDLAAHEALHRDFLAAAIPALGGELIPNLSVDFSSIDFSDRDAVLGVARTLEDTGVSAYNGAGIFLQDADLLTIAGKIVSVEARHAAAVRSIINPGSADFAGDDVVDPITGLDQALPPSEILAAVAATGLVTTEIEVQNT